MRCKLSPHMVHLYYAIAPQTLQYFLCLLTVSADFRWWYNIIRSPQKRDFLPPRVFVYLYLFFYSIIKEYSCSGPTLFLLTDVAVLLWWVAPFFVYISSYVYQRGNYSEGGINSTSELRGNPWISRRHMGTHTLSYSQVLPLYTQGTYHI